MTIINLIRKYHYLVWRTSQAFLWHSTFLCFSMNEKTKSPKDLWAHLQNECNVNYDVFLFLHWICIIVLSYPLCLEPGVDSKAFTVGMNTIQHSVRIRKIPLYSEYNPWLCIYALCIFGFSMYLYLSMYLRWRVTWVQPITGKLLVFPNNSVDSNPKQ